MFAGPFSPLPSLAVCSVVVTTEPEGLGLNPSSATYSYVTLAGYFASLFPHGKSE